LGYDDVLSDLWGDSSDEGSPSVVQWNAVKVAQYFDREVRSASWSNGYTLTHITALASQLKKWRTAGKTEEEVKELIDFYVKEPLARGPNPGWRDFLYRAEQNSAKLQPKEEVVPEKELSPLDKAREIGTYEAFLEVLRSPKVAQKYYDKYKEEHGQG
jgi:hypothetical protein